MKTGAYYHRYIGALINFLVPADSRVFVARIGASIPTALYDYVVLSDVLGRTLDIQATLSDFRRIVDPRTGRLVITQYNRLWEPVLKLASRLALRRREPEPNWLSMHDLENFLALSGWEPVIRFRKMLLPVHIPLLSGLINRYLANLPLINRLCLVNIVVARPTPPALNAKPSVSIIIPARNESGTIRRIIDELPDCGAFTELIFVEGNSTDDTRETIRREVASYSGSKSLLWAAQRGKGKGDAVRLGFSMASGDILMIYDADMTVPPDDIRKFYDAIASGITDFVNGSRLVYPMERESMRTLNYIANKFFGMAFSWLLGRNLKDTLCGTKVFWKHDYESIARGREFFGDFDPFGDFDLLFGAAKLNLVIRDLPVRYRERVYGETNISRFRHGWLLLQMVVFAARKLNLSDMFDTRNYFNDIAADYDFWKRKNWYYHARLKDLYREYIPDGSRVLEIGCGTGDILAALKPERGLGIDISEEMVGIAREKYAKSSNLDFRAFDIASDSLSESFAYIVIPDVLEHVGDPSAFLQAVARACDSRTRIVLSVANPLYEPILEIAERLGMKMPEGPHTRLPIKHMASLFNQCGLHIIESGTRMLLPKPVPGADWINTRFHALPGVRSLGWVVYWVLATSPTTTKPSKTDSHRRPLSKRMKGAARAMLNKFGINVTRYREPESPLILLKHLNIRTIIDIGANVGQFAAEARQALPNAQIYSFEPLDHCYRELILRFRGDTRFLAFNIALGDRDMFIEMTASPFTPSSSLLPMARLHEELFPYSKGGTKELVKVKRLDDITQQLEINEPLCIKMDVQGYEDRVIRGGNSLFRRASMVIAETSFSPLYEGQLLYSEIHNLLSGFGYQYAGSLNQYVDPQTRIPIYQDSIFVRTVAINGPDSI